MNGWQGYVKKYCHFMYFSLAKHIKIRKKDFTKTNQRWLDTLHKYRDKNFPELDNGIMTNENMPINIQKVKKPVVEVKKLLKEYDEERSREEINATMNDLNEMNQKILSKETPLEQKEKYIKKMTKRAVDHRFLFDKNNAKTTREIAREWKSEDSFQSAPTYLDELDRLIGGGFEKSKTSVISAESGNGKSTLGVQSMVFQAMNGYKPAFISLEQSHKSIFDSLMAVVSQSAGKTKDYFARGKIQSKEEEEYKQEEVMEIIEKTLRDNVIIEDNSQDTYTTPESIYERIIQMEYESIDIVYIDNFQNLTPKPGENNTEFYKRFANLLLRAAQKTGIAVVSMSQLTNNNGKKKTSWAAKLNHDASTHISLNKTTGELKGAVIPEIIEIDIIKSRSAQGNKKEKNGDKKVLQFMFNGKKGLIGKVNRPERFDFKEKEDYKAKDFNEEQNSNVNDIIDEAEEGELPF